MLNAAFESKLTLEDKGYESGSENFNIPTPLRQTSRIHHVSSDENISFDPSTPCLYTNSYHLVALTMKKVLQLHIPSTYSTLPPYNPMGFAQQPLSKSIYTICDDLEEEDFQTVALDDEHWITEPVPDRHLCIHEHSQPHSLCPYPFPCSTD